MMISLTEYLDWRFWLVAIRFSCSFTQVYRLNPHDFRRSTSLLSRNSKEGHSPTAAYICRAMCGTATAQQLATRLSGESSRLHKRSVAVSCPPWKKAPDPLPTFSGQHLGQSYQFSTTVWSSPLRSGRLCISAEAQSTWLNSTFNPLLLHSMFF